MRDVAGEGLATTVTISAGVLGASYSTSGCKGVKISELEAIVLLKGRRGGNGRR